MKYTLFPLLALFAIGCGQRSEFDVSADQVKKQARRGGLGGPPGTFRDIKNLPPGAVKHEKIYHKGDRLPDGTISPDERRQVTIEVGK